MQLRRGDIAQVDWGDAYSTTGWKDSTKKDCVPHPVTCVGAVVVDDPKRGILLTHGFAKDGQNLGEMFIPKGMIYKKKLLVRNEKIKPYRK